MSDQGESEQLATLRQMVQLQARVCYMNVDRTLATWTRTALSLIVFGVVVDRFGLLMMQNSLAHLGTPLAPNPLSSLGGITLIAFGVLMATSAAVRHRHYEIAWDRVYGQSEREGPYLAFTFAVMAAVFGAVVLVLLLVLAR